MIQAPTKPEKFQVFWRDWKGEWATNGEKYVTKAKAQRFVNIVKKAKAENGVYTIQVIS